MIFHKELKRIEEELDENFSVMADLEKLLQRADIDSKTKVSKRFVDDVDISHYLANLEKRNLENQLVKSEKRSFHFMDRSDIKKYVNSRLLQNVNG